MAELRRRPGRKWFKGLPPGATRACAAAECVPRPDTQTLRDGRPPPPEERGSPCQRCGETTEEIACVLRDYWVCPECRRAHEALAAYGWRVGEAMKGRRVRR